MELEEKVGEYGIFDDIDLRKECCHVRKILPLMQALKGYDGWISGIRSAQSITRSDTKLVEYDAKFELLKFNPLAHFSDEEVEKLKDVLNNIGNPKFTSSGNVINVFRAEKAFVFIPDSNYMMNMALRKADSKIVGDFQAFKNTKDEKNMNIASNDEDFYGMVVPVGINGSFEFSIKELEDLDKLKMKLCGAIKQFEEATGWAKSDVESWENFIKRNTANDEIDYGESFKNFLSNKALFESSFGDKMADLIREVYQKLPLEEAGKFYVDFTKMIAKYSFVDRSNVPVGNTPSLGNKELDNTEDVTIPRPAQPVEKPRPSEID